MARDWLQKLRQQKDMSQLQLGKAAGIRPPEKYGRIEKGYTDIDPASAAGLAEFFGVAASFIATGADATSTQAPPVEKTVRVEPSNESATAVKPERKEIALPAPRGLAARRQAEGEEPKVVTTAHVVYDGGEILDPTNFQAMPPVAELERQGRDALTYRAAVKVLISRANKVLHTSKIPAKVWLAWRDFEKRAQSMLIERDPMSSAPVYTQPSVVPPRNNPAPAPTPAPASIPSSAVPTPAPKVATDGRRSHKNFAGHFFDAARDILPPESFSQLEKRAMEAKSLDQSAGFMKHFHRLSQQQLTPAEYAALEAKVRNAGSYHAA